MLKQPFSGKELYIQYEIEMGRLNLSMYSEEERAPIEQEEWDAIGKTKKQAWNNLAKLINRRMIEEKIDPV